MIGGATTIAAYYLVPYGGRVPIVGNLELYREFGALAVQAAETGDPLAGPLRISSIYFSGLYIVPLLLALLSAGAWRRARYKGHRANFARLAGWGATRS